MFEMTVEITQAIKGRGTVAGGVLLSGHLRTGEMVIIEAEGRPPLEALLAGIEFDIPRPKVGILLRDVTPEDVPIGARIRSAGR